MPHYIPKYKIIRTEEFIVKSHELSKAFKRTPELIKAIDWALSRKPHHFENISGDFYLWVNEELANEDFPTVRVLYRINEVENTVILMDISEK